MLCPLFVAGGRKIEECECVRENCGFWSEIKEASKDDDDEPAWIEGCALRLIPRSLESLRETIGDVEEIADTAESVLRDVRNVWTAVALVAGEKLSVDIPQVFEIVDSMYQDEGDEGDEDEDGEQPQLEFVESEEDDEQQ